jgi:hypothetical protein
MRPATSGWVTTARWTSRNRGSASGDCGKSLTIMPTPREAVTPTTPSPTAMAVSRIHSGQLKAACGRSALPAASSRYTPPVSASSSSAARRLIVVTRASGSR